jgi:hypothetical protein
MGYRWFFSDIRFSKNADPVTDGAWALVDIDTVWAGLGHWVVIFLIVGLCLTQLGGPAEAVP